MYGWAEHQQMLSLFTMVSKSTVATVGVKPEAKASLMITNDKQI